MKRKFGLNQPAQAIGWVSECFADITAPRGVQITVEPVEEPHSESQRGKYWASLHRFGEWLGYSKKESEIYIHEEVLKECFGVDKVNHPRGLPGGIEIPRQRSHDANKTDYAKLIDTLVRIAAEQGYQIEDAA